jgi:hypothetical protein
MHLRLFPGSCADFEPVCWCATKSKSSGWTDVNFFLMLFNTTLIMLGFCCCCDGTGTVYTPLMRERGVLHLSQLIGSPHGLVTHQKQSGGMPRPSIACGLHDMWPTWCGTMKSAEGRTWCRRHPTPLHGGQYLLRCGHTACLC